MCVSCWMRQLLASMGAVDSAAACLDDCEFCRFFGCAFSQNYSDVAVGLSNVVKMPFRSWALASPDEQTSGVG